jgi:hypothetical protein
VLAEHAHSHPRRQAELKKVQEQVQVREQATSPVSLELR